MPVENIPFSAFKNLSESENSFILAKIPRNIWEAIRTNDLQRITNDRAAMSNLKDALKASANNAKSKNTCRPMSNGSTHNMKYSSFLTQKNALSSHLGISEDDDSIVENKTQIKQFNQLGPFNQVNVNLNKSNNVFDISDGLKYSSAYIQENSQSGDDDATDDDGNRRQQVKTKRFKNKKTKTLETDEKSGEKIIKGSWTQEEDDILRDLVLKFGPKRWSSIAEHLPHRVGKQCRERWLNHLDPSINKGEWSDQEDQIIVVMQDRMGNRWARISKCLRGRTPNAVKNHWNSTLQKKADGLRRIYLTQEDPLAGIDKQMRRHFEMLVKDCQRSDKRKKNRSSSASDSASDDDDRIDDDDDE